MRVLSRTAEDKEFRRALMDLQTEALESYDLSLEAKSALRAEAAARCRHQPRQEC